jgi:hypothetical protein
MEIFRINSSKIPHAEDKEQLAESKEPSKIFAGGEYLPANRHAAFMKKNKKNGEKT